MNKDLTIDFGASMLNIRVLLLIKYKGGYLFELNTDDYYFAIGGRVKFGESSSEAAKRELKEELDYNDLELELIGLIENFFVIGEKSVHEVNFVYGGAIKDEIDFNNLKSNHKGFSSLLPEDVMTSDVRPKVLKELIPKLLSNYDEIGEFIHLVNRDSA
ncbi:MAG TPA: NUDIX domain-containing protein [Candidatus Dojkabacteria bacterium]|nr:NUDIX domain-containing protein [Candidatus Dojkabacteria bacterium]HRO65695.1 NUDIX domain-containing protein [Candidatus Dojkabacteria bacterium]HRP36482.1 NUDIX domain-containing protein [Candidatus Dojkabacteria bacterium]HRP51138.1 NUDIX domain-containing protein [Candidatus Dojkabacteria bacterium]